MATETESAVQDRDRLAALRGTGLLDSAPEERFDRLTRLVSLVLGVPVVLVSLVDDNRQFFKSCVGLPEPWASERETPLSHSFCQHVVASREPLMVEDARDHPLVRDNLAIRDLGVIAYAGIPLITSDGQVLGSFCAIDTQPRKWTEEEIQTLQDLAGAVSTEIELRKFVRDAADEIRKTASAGAESEAARQHVTQILESIADAFFAVDRDWRVTYMNREAETLLHRKRDDLIGKKLWEEFPEAVGSSFYNEYHRAVEHGETVQFEEFFPPLDTWFEVRAYPSEDGLSVYFRDINERRRTEEVLRESERRLEEQSYLTRTITDNATVGMFMMDVKGHATFMNPAAEEMTGYTLDEIRGMPLHDAIHHTHPDGTPYPLSECPVDRALPENNDIRAHEDIFVRKDGTFFPVTVAARPIIRDGKPTGTVVEVRDVTDEKRAEEALRASEERFRLMFRDNPLPMWAFDLETKQFLDVNETAIRQYGYSREEFLAMTIQDIRPPEEIPQLAQAFAPDHQGIVHRGLFHHRKKDGSIIDVEVTTQEIALNDRPARVALVLDVTARRLAEQEREHLIQAFNRERARLTELFREAPAIIATTRGPNHVFEMANPPYLQLIGDRDILGKPVAEAVPEVVEQGFLALLDQVYSSGEPFLGNEVPVLLQRTPGALPEERFVNFVYQPVREVDGTVGGIFVHGVDVTDQVRARQQVERLEERLRLALEAADVGTYDWNIASGALNWDPRARHIFGVPDEGEVSYGLFLERLHPEDREEANRVVQEALDLAGSGEFATEYRIVQPDRTLRWVRALGRVYFAGEGSERHAVRFLGTVQDVTEQHQLQQQLEAERVRLREVFQQAPAMIAVLRGQQHVFEIANPPYLALVGRRDVLGKPIREAIPEVEGQGYFEMLDGVYQTGEPVVGNEMRALLDRTGDGKLEEGYFNFVFHPLREADGTVGGILIHAVEVTEQVHARQEVERNAEELARTARALEATNRELDQFAYVASHDLKAPLRGIANLSQWIEEDIADALSDENRQQMNLLRGRVHRMEGLIEGILQYSRAGRATGKPEQVDTGALVRDIAELLDPPEHVTIQIAEDLPTLETERLPLQQVLMNLISNAIKYTDRPDARVEVTAHDAGEFVEFAVADNGPGIAPEYHEKIFAIFQRLEARDQVEGTGIGLSLVKKIVEGRGGRVWVESQEGQGTTFRFTWPKMPERTF